jgi:serine/threonine protein kinase
MLSDLEYRSRTGYKTSLNSTDDDYAIILRSHGLEYKIAGYYYQVGEISKTQGWILHLTVVMSQIREMLESIIPFLKTEEVPFKIAMNESTCEDLLIGNLGLAQIGKIVSIYPDNDAVALDLAKKLNELTRSYRGPIIPTDICLGNTLYTRYGSFNPIIKLNANGTEEKYIYDGEGQLVRDSYAMPFNLPNGVAWPFRELTEPILQAPPKLLNHIYKLVDILKLDPRGNVYKGLYVKNLLHLKKCVIKQGFSNMSSDKAGRDIQDRLIWQNELYKELSDIVPMPEIYDLFQEKGSTVLIMQLIKGNSLFDKLLEINPLSKSWAELPIAESLRLLKYAIEITKIIECMHKRGYVHRDIVPVNFLIDKQDRIILIDIELAYSLKHKTPDPPFKLGTPGFMSPEQEAAQRPTIEEDIYGLGATLLYMLTGIFPVKFNTQDTKRLSKSLIFFIGNVEIATTIANSLHHDPLLRPAVSTILAVLVKYQLELQTKLKFGKDHQRYPILDAHKVKELISSALEGLNNSPIVVMNELWYSKQITIENSTAPKNKQYAINPGIAEGISGVLFVLARVHRVGISIGPCRKGFTKCLKLLEDCYINRLPEMSAGLYKGAAGFALALAESVRSGLLEDNDLNRDKIQNCLRLQNEKVNLADGIAGQGLSILQCQCLLKKEFFQPLLDKIVLDLLNIQQKDGSWLQVPAAKKGKSAKIMNIGYDDTGIIWFLLQYFALYPKMEVQNALIKGLGSIVNNRNYMQHFYNLVASKASYEIVDGGKGLIIVLIKAYETLQEDTYKRIAESALLKYPLQIIHTNISQENGLAAIGEIYLEAWRVFKNEEWKYRADWIANVYIHSLFKTTDNSGYWVMEQNNPPTADFLAGNGGIIHFLTRCLNPGKIGYRLLE